LLNNEVYDKIVWTFVSPPAWRFVLNKKFLLRILRCIAVCEV